MKVYYSQQGQFVPNSHMIAVVEEYIYRETGESVEIADPEFLDERQKLTVNKRDKELLIKAYCWAMDHL